MRFCFDLTVGALVSGATDMADQKETFGLQNSPSGSESKELHTESKAEKQNGTSSKSPSSQTTYIQQVSFTRYFVLQVSSHCLGVVLDLYLGLRIKCGYL